MVSAAQGATKSLIPDFPRDRRLFFLMGSDLARLAQARRELLRKLMTREEREQNFAELGPTSGQMLALSKAAGSILDELQTPSFFPDQRRVLYVSQLQELFTASKKPSRAKAKKGKGADEKRPAADGKADPAQRFVEYLAGDFQTAKNVLVVEAIEDEDKRRKVDGEKSPLAAYLLRHAVVFRFHQPPMRYKLEDALLERQASEAIAAYREWISPDSRFAVLGVIVDTVRCTLQAALAKQIGGARSARLQGRTVDDLLPGGWRNLRGKPPVSRQKYEAAARRYHLMELIDGLERVPELSAAFFPPQNAPFVRDLDAAVESFILRLCAR